MRWQLIGLGIVGVAGLAACGDDSAGSGGAGSGSGGGSASSGDGATTTAASSSSSGEASGGAGGGGEYIPGPDEILLETPEYTVEAGEEINYLCISFRIPRGVTVREIEPLYGDAIHHIGLYQTLVRDPEGVFDCPELVRDTWIPLYGGGLDSGVLSLPENTGFQLDEDQQVVLQLHLLNVTPNDVVDTAAMILRTTEDEDIVPAGLFGIDNRGIELPPRSEDVESVMSCTPDHDLDVFAVFGHMHTLGTFIQLSRGDAPGDDVIFEQDYSFEEQPTTPLVASIPAGEQIFVRCLHDNPTDETITYGESTYQEMCSLALYYTPFTGLDGCVTFGE